ncbi:hypothetical protein SAMN05421803_106145 [Nocardiopsis flavescens]|uniref:SMI1/KNR4 family protein n=1 Tax=Nocardiopsis flavescens TaxID=758803 RepID=A0A1M6JI53_9ACTN|nr:hypothetical protein [Nocardiopsis flavescens]SHJ46356.1 hypothetical protein SAMN05421803_106145 [Nocardiopsis flavescens]
MNEHQALDTPERWRAFLADYSAALVRTAPHTPRDRAGSLPEEAPWPGRAPARAQDVTAGPAGSASPPLPPSLRAFLAVSDGWSRPHGAAERVHGSADLRWFRESDTGADLIEIYGFEPQGAEDLLALFGRALEVAGHEEVWLLDPGDVRADGEWAAYVFHPGDGELERFADFGALMRAGLRLLRED